MTDVSIDGFMFHVDDMNQELFETISHEKRQTKIAKEIRKEKFNKSKKTTKEHDDDYDAKCNKKGEEKRNKTEKKKNVRSKSSHSSSHVMNA